MNDSDTAAELRQLAHDVRNALNGVAVNLAVARARAARGVDGAQLAPFIETAVQQLDVATRLHKRYTEVATGVAADNVARSGARSADSALNDSHPHS